MVTTADRRLVEVQGRVAVRGCQRVRADIQVGDGNGTAARGIQGKAPGKAEGIQHPATVGQGLDEAAVVTLVEKKTCLLSADHIDFETKSRLQEGDRIEQGLSANNLSFGERLRFVLNISAQA